MSAAELIERANGILVDLAALAERLPGSNTRLPRRSRGQLNGMSTTPQPNPVKDPEDWVTGDEPMTGPQASYLETLCREAGREFDPELAKADASQLIDELQGQTGRGQAGGPSETTTRPA